MKFLQKINKHVLIIILSFFGSLLILSLFGEKNVREPIQKETELSRLFDLREQKELSIKEQKEIKKNIEKTLKEEEKKISSIQGELDTIYTSINRIIDGNISQYLTEEKNSKGEIYIPVAIPSGESSKDKVRDFVALNCSDDVREVFDDVYDYAESKGVKGETPFIIAFADSQCGKNLSTPNNPMNVLNNDRGNRVGFFTMEEGFKFGIDALNNKYLRGNTEWWQLSQGGRISHGSKYDCSNAPTPYKCYATSEENWHNNTQRALQSIYGEKNDSLLFRL